jgi:Protein of unknown function (DUF3822)
MARLMGKAIRKICRLLTPTCKWLCVLADMGEKGGKPTIFKFLSIIAPLENRNLKQLFHIKNSNSNNGQQVLSVRLGEKHCSFAITDKSGNELYQLFYCTTDEWNEKELADFLTSYPVLNNSFYQVQVAYDFPQSVLLSSKQYRQEDAELLLSTSGFKSGIVNIVTEPLIEWQFENIYAVPKEIQEWVNKIFPASKSRHQYSLEIKNINPVSINGSVLVDFRKEDFTVVMVKGSQFLLAQTFDYSTPADVLYYLLKICQQFSLSQQELQLQLSGLIDKQSALYSELYQYFINVEFREASWNDSNEYPAHFFTSLNDLAKCVS